MTIPEIKGEVWEYKGTFYTYVDGPNEHGQSVWQDANDGFEILPFSDSEWNKHEPTPDAVFVVFTQNIDDPIMIENIADALDSVDLWDETYPRSAHHRIAKFVFESWEN